MNLAEWVAEQATTARQAGGGDTAKLAILKVLAKRAGVSWQTLEPVTRGARMGNYGKARQVAEATDWKVSVLELCDEAPAVMAKRIAEQVAGS